ncbi:alpha/beta hydrolase [Massilia aquatica]|uniref:alpha/beta hydrolase n=1 Tax=Massilia aquatica TaxID=2609000 RepID=UPI0014225058|nr:alpha/beta hydrolase [Massilia aquatica]
MTRSVAFKFPDSFFRANPINSFAVANTYWHGRRRHVRQWLATCDLEQREKKGTKQCCASGHGFSLKIVCTILHRYPGRAFHRVTPSSDQTNRPSMKRALALIAVSLLLASCATTEVQRLPPIPEIKAAYTDKEVKYPVLYGTSRMPNSAKTAYLDQRAGRVQYGRVIVTIPKGRMTGSLGENGIFSPRDTRLAIAAGDIEFHSQDSFMALAKSQLGAGANPESGYLLVFIHGYNNSFEDAALRAAQLGFDLNVAPNNMMFFSWAANKNYRKYTHDEATADASEIHLEAFLKTVRAAAGGRKVHIIAHSMGNRPLLRVISRMQVLPGEKKPFGQIILAAPDVDRDVFMHYGQNYLKVAERTTVYLSPFDFAMQLSQDVHFYPRVGCGNKPQAEIKDIDSIVSFIPEDFPAHTYVASTLPLLNDVKNLFVNGKPARQGAAWKAYPTYWTVGPAHQPGRSSCSALPG